MSTGSPYSQCCLRHLNGIPIKNTDILNLRENETAALWCRTGLKLGEQDRALARLGANLQGAAEAMVSACWRQDLNMPMGPSVSFGSGERASRCDAKCQTATKRFKHPIRSTVIHEKSSETTSCKSSVPSARWPRLSRATETPQRSKTGGTVINVTQQMDFPRATRRNGKRREWKNRSIFASRTSRPDSL